MSQRLCCARCDAPSRRIECARDRHQLTDETQSLLRPSDPSEICSAFSCVLAWLRSLRIWSALILLFCALADMSWPNRTPLDPRDPRNGRESREDREARELQQRRQQRARPINEPTSHRLQLPPAGPTLPPLRTSFIHPHIGPSSASTASSYGPPAPTFASSPYSTPSLSPASSYAPRTGTRAYPTPYGHSPAPVRLLWPCAVADRLAARPSQYDRLASGRL